jgi:hypothetical protein
VDAEELSRIYLAKAAAELSAADRLLPGSERIACRGAAIADIVLVCGQPEEADVAAGEALSGPVGEAAGLALEALSVEADSVLAVCSRPVAGAAEARARRLEVVIEAADPDAVIALDPEAAADLAAACRLETLAPGRQVQWRGRVVGSVGDLGASLADATLKRQVWSAFRAIMKGVSPPRSR